MPVHSQNSRLAPLSAVEAHIFWGYRSFLDFEASHGRITGNVVIADKGFLDRTRTVFSINRAWGRMGRFVVNPAPEPVTVEPFEMLDYGDVLELGQDRADFSYAQDSAGYEAWLQQWPDRRFRPHPKVGTPDRPLVDDLALAGLVVGLNTSALVAASAAGKRVEAFGAHSMANGIGGVREARLDWLNSIEWDRRDPRLPECLAACLEAPELSSVCPEGVRPTRASGKATRKKAPSARRAKKARGKRGGRSGGGSGESA
jgi:hypothetical protein